MTDDEALSRIRDVMKRCFTGVQGAEIGRETSSLDVDGWDSLTHNVLVLEAEREFGLAIPLEKAMEIDDVGSLVDLFMDQQVK